jgi:hypothetical protein
MNKIHYVYKITNNNPQDKQKYYIGVRSTTHTNPHNDMNYNSSSTYLKQILCEIGHKNFSKEILSIWKTRKEANDEEVRLHELYDVARNPEFYNKAKAKGDTFCTEGMVYVINNITGKSDFVTIEESRDKSKYHYHHTNVVSCKNIVTGESVRVTKEEYKNNPNLAHTVKGTVTAIDKETGIRRQVTLEEFKNNPNLVGQNIGKIVVTDTRTGKKCSVSREDFEKYEYYEQVTKGTLTVIDKRDNNTKKVTIEEFQNNDFYITPKSKTIGIFNENNELVDVSYTGFQKFCKERKMPGNAFAISLQNNSQPLYENTGSNESRLEAYGYLKFRGWYAKEISS